MDPAASNDNDEGTPIVGHKAIAAVLGVTERSVKRYARSGRWVQGKLVRPRLLLKHDHATDHVFIGAKALDGWRKSCVRAHGREEESVDVPASETRPLAATRPLAEARCA